MSSKIFAKCEKDGHSPRTIASTHPRFHTMVLSGQPKTQNPNENKVLRNESWNAFKNSYNLKKLLRPLGK
jgi:hypothetical protein